MTADPRVREFQALARTTLEAVRGSMLLDEFSMQFDPVTGCAVLLLGPDVDVDRIAAWLTEVRSAHGFGDVMGRC